ncbi:unnamed protein product, partial [Polarella glacialis]
QPPPPNAAGPPQPGSPAASGSSAWRARQQAKTSPSFDADAALAAMKKQKGKS